MKEFLWRKGVEFPEYDVTKDPAALEETVAISRPREVPVTSICDEVTVGFDPGRLEQTLNRLKNLTSI